MSNEEKKPVAQAKGGAVKKTDKKFMVGQICRYTPGFKQAKEIIDSGAIGELTFVESEYAHDYSGIYAKETWRSDPVRNGVVGGGCHAVDLLRWIAGLVDTEIDEAIADYNNDGKVNARDARALLRKIAGLD